MFLCRLCPSCCRTHVHTGSLCLHSAAASVPHPEKEFKGGEDAHFVYGDAHAIGVADGVGGWANVGVDAGLYAKELMMRTRDALRSAPPDARDPLEALARAHAETQSQGSATACVLLLNDDVRTSILHPLHAGARAACNPQPGLVLPAWKRGQVDGPCFFFR